MTEKYAINTSKNRGTTELHKALASGLHYSIREVYFGLEKMMGLKYIEDWRPRHSFGSDEVVW